MWRVLWVRSALWSAPPQRQGDREGGFVLSRQDCSWFLSALTQLYPLPLNRPQAHPSGHTVPLQLEPVSFMLPGLRSLHLHPSRPAICSWASLSLNIWLLHIKVEMIICQQRLTWASRGLACRNFASLRHINLILCWESSCCCCCSSKSVNIL